MKSIIDHLEKELKPKFANSVFTWHQLERALEKLKTHTFKTLVFKEGENKGKWAYLINYGEFYELHDSEIPDLYPQKDNEELVFDLASIHPDIDFSQVELVEVEVTIK